MLQEFFLFRRTDTYFLCILYSQALSYENCCLFSSGTAIHLTFQAAKENKTLVFVQNLTIHPRQENILIQLQSSMIWLISWLTEKNEEPSKSNSEASTLEYKRIISQAWGQQSDTVNCWQHPNQACEKRSLVKSLMEKSCHSYRGE